MQKHRVNTKITNHKKTHKQHHRPDLESKFFQKNFLRHKFLICSQKSANQFEVEKTNFRSFSVTLQPTLVKG